MAFSVPIITNASRNDVVNLGDSIFALSGKIQDYLHSWSGQTFRRYALSDGKGVARLNPDPALPLSVYMHALGNGGFVAWGGLLEIGKAKAGETVFVSTAAGSVGVAVQLVKGRAGKVR